MRAVILGLLGASFICGFTYFNDCVLHQSLLISDHMPVVIYGGLILFVGLLNPLLRRLRPSWALSPRELAVTLALVLASCTVPAFGLMRTFTASLMLPHYHTLKEPSWRENKVVGMVPEKMLADISRDENETLTTFIQGGATGNQHIAFRQIPWSAWSRTLVFWLPLIVALWFTCIALAVVVHPQWANHEQLPYPIAKFADSLLSPDDGEGGGRIITNKLFLGACGFVCFIYSWNYLCGWFPQLVPVNMQLKFWPLGQLVPTFMDGGGGRLLSITIRFMPIGFAYFLANDVAFSLGIGPYLWCFIVGLFMKYGISLEGGDYLSLKTSSFINFGAYFGFFIAILFWGRHYYKSVFRKAIGLKDTESIEPQYVWAARCAMVGALLFTFFVWNSGLDLPLAVLYSGGALIIFVVVGRITAETGLFFLQVWTFPCVVLWGLLGPQALGPDTLAVLCLISCVILLDPREALMPYMVNSIKLLDLHRARIGRTAALCAVSVLLGLLIAVPVTLYFQYDRGLFTMDGWTQLASGFPFQNAVKIKRDLMLTGDLDKAQSLSGWARFANARPQGRCVIGLLAGVVVVLLFSVARVRFSWWPLHPVMFLVWGTYPMWRFGPCFLFGWLVKVVVVKYGGARLYRQLTPLMLGLIAGEILGYLVSIVAGLGYWAVTGELPRFSFWR